MHKPIFTAKDQLIKTIKSIEEQQKTINSSDLITILKYVKRIYRNTELIEAMANSIHLLLDQKIQNRNKLTARESQVMLLIGDGMRNTEIAKSLNLSPSTVETHRKNIRKKLKIKSSNNLIVFATIYNLQYHNISHIKYV